MRHPHAILVLTLLLTAPSPLAPAADTPPTPVVPPAPAPAPAPVPAPAAPAGHPVLGVTEAEPDAGADPQHPLDAVFPPAVIGRVAPHTTAEAMGLKPGDTVLSVDGVSVQDFNGLVAGVRKHQVGDRIALVVRRASQRLELSGILQGSQTAQGTAEPQPAGRPPHEHEDGGIVP